MTTTHPERFKLDHCPPWCAGHDGRGYQSWEDHSDGQQARTHASESVPIVNRMRDGRREELAVDVSQNEHSIAGMSAAVVDLYAGGDLVELSPAEARRTAAALLEAADRAESVR